MPSSLAISPCCWACCVWQAWAGRRVHVWTAVLALGFACGLLASVLSGTRGGWIAIPPVLALALFGCRQHLSRKTLCGLVLATVALLPALYWLPGSPVKQRVQQALADIQHYQNGSKETSLGLRLEMWRAGLHAVQDAPLLGHGQQGLWRHIKEQVEHGDITPGVLNFNQLHNDYLDIAARRGLIGLTALLALYWLPLWRFCVGLRNQAARPPALAGAVLCVSYTCYSLTQGFLTHNSGVMMFFFTLVICLSMMRQAKDENSENAVCKND